jgi:hypothetical protein
MILAIGGGCLLLVRCAGGGIFGGLLYYIHLQQDKVVGKWVVDPDDPVNASLIRLHRTMRIEFSKPDKRCTLSMSGVELAGPWHVVRNRENDAILVLVDFEEFRGPAGQRVDRDKFQAAFEITPVDADHIDLVDTKDRSSRMRMKKVPEFDTAPDTAADPKNDEGPAPHPDRPRNDPNPKTNTTPKPDTDPDTKPRRELKEIASFQLPNEHRYLDETQFSPDGKTLVTTSRYGLDNDLKCVEVPTGKEKKTKAGAGFGGSFAFAPDGRLYVAFEKEDEHEVRLWDLGKDQIVKRFKFPTRVRDIELSPDGKILVCLLDANDPGADLARRILLIDVATGRVRTTFDGTGTPTFSPNGRVVACATARGGAVKLYDLEANKELHVLKGHRGDVRVLIFVDDRVLVTSTGRVILVGEKEDRTVRVWNVETGQQTAQFECPHEPENVALFPDGKTLVTTHKDKSMRFWSVETGKDVGVITPMQRERVWHLTFTPDGKALITTHYEQGLILWEIPSRKKALALKPRSVYGLQPVFTRDGKLMALPYSDGALKLYELR